MTSEAPKLMHNLFAVVSELLSIQWRFIIPLCHLIAHAQCGASQADIEGSHFIPSAHPLSYSQGSWNPTTVDESQATSKSQTAVKYAASWSVFKCERVAKVCSELGSWVLRLTRVYVCVELRVDCSSMSGG